MIGADPDQGAIIRKAEISKKFDILVYGPNDRPVDPDRDLMCFPPGTDTRVHLALTEVSEAEAPNVIDTPLGMMSGYVKRSVLKLLSAKAHNWSCFSHALKLQTAKKS